MNTNNSSGSKKLLRSDSRKPRSTVLTAAIVSKLMTVLWEHYTETFFSFCLPALYLRNMGDDECHLLYVFDSLI